MACDRRVLPEDGYGPYRPEGLPQSQGLAAGWPGVAPPEGDLLVRSGLLPVPDGRGRGSKEEHQGVLSTK